MNGTFCQTVVGKFSNGRARNNLWQVWLVVDARLHFGARSLGAVPGVLGGIVNVLGNDLRRLPFVLRAYGISQRLDVCLVVEDGKVLLRLGVEFGPFAVSSLPVDGQLLGSSNTSDVLVQQACGLAVRI